VGIFVLVFLSLGFFVQSRREDRNNPGVTAQF
jgi:hypothetical protein